MGELIGGIVEKALIELITTGQVIIEVKTKEEITEKVCKHENIDYEPLYKCEDCKRYLFSIEFNE